MRVLVCVCVVDTGCRACVVVRGVWREVFLGCDGGGKGIVVNK